MTVVPRPCRGLILGKFMPPHLGHCYFVGFAQAYVRLSGPWDTRFETACAAVEDLLSEETVG